jgi:hypothetical protein
MKMVLAGLRAVATLAVVIAAVSALAGFLIAHFASLGGVAEGIGWGMAIGGGLVALVVGQSGSPARMSVEGRWQFAAGNAWYYWGRNPALPQSPLWALASAVVVLAAGIAVVVLSY